MERKLLLSPLSLLIACALLNDPIHWNMFYDEKFLLMRYNVMRAAPLSSILQSFT